MTELENKIRDYLSYSVGMNEEDINKDFEDSRKIACFIAAYAHRNQQRINGDKYFIHPYSVAMNFRKILCTYKFDGDLMIDLGIPFYGVEELCYLHDVVEDTDITIKEIEDIFDDHPTPQYLNSFKSDIKSSLVAITHKKGETYDEYFSRVLSNEKASLVKMLDIQDNLVILHYSNFDEKAKDRTINYVNRFHQIDQKYHWLSKIEEYVKSPRNIYDDWEDW